jgi:hypothetical protein
MKEKRNQKFIGGFIEKVKAKAMAQARAKNPAILSMPTIGQLENHIERGLYGKGGNAKKK